MSSPANRRVRRGQDKLIDDLLQAGYKLAMDGHKELLPAISEAIYVILGLQKLVRDMRAVEERPMQEVEGAGNGANTHN